MRWEQTLDGFDFDDHLVVDDDIDAIGRFEMGAALL
jgi:hypothetical protein